MRVETWIVALVVVSFSLPMSMAQQRSHNLMGAERNGYIRAENGTFSVTDDEVCAYSSTSGPETLLTRQCSKLVAGKWKPTSANEYVKSGPANYVDFGPCDPLNQLNIAIQHSEIASMLPRSSRIKQVIETSDLAAVVYAVPPLLTVTYPLRLAVFDMRSNKSVLASDLPIGDQGTFCGSRVIVGHSQTNVLVYVDEPAGSSDYSAIQSFRVYW